MIGDKAVQEIKTLLSKKKKIVITTHYNPDGDAMGSSLGLYHFLKLLKHQVHVITPNSWPSFLNWMPGVELCITGTEQLKKAEQHIEKADILFCLDYNALHRTEILAKALEQAKGTKILIDHHIQPENFAQYTLSNTKASSTCEMIFDFIQLLDKTLLINPDCATCLYTGITTDTGSFKFPSTTAQTHRVISFLIDKGVENSKIHQHVFDTYTLDRMRLLGFCLSEKLTVLNEYQTAFIALSAQELVHFNHQKGDTEGLVNYALSILGIRFSVLFVERESEIKISFRSKGQFDVNNFARAHFAGGGHKNAAGGCSLLTLDETIMQFVELLPQYKNTLNNES